MRADGAHPRVINGQGPRSYALIREHLTDYPRDMLMIRLAQRLCMLGCSGAGIASFPAPLFALMQDVASAYGDDWAFLGQYAFAHHETGRLAEARRLAARSLALRPTNATAAHSVAHVFFETGDAVGGGAFLGPWLMGFDARRSINLPPKHVHQRSPARRAQQGESRLRPRALDQRGVVSDLELP